MLNISEDAAKFIKESVDQNKNSNMIPVLMSAGAGCGTPAIKFEMRQALEDDEISEHSGLSIHIRSGIARYIENAELVMEETFWGKKLKVKTEYGCR